MFHLQVTGLVMGSPLSSQQLPEEGSRAYMEVKTRIEQAVHRFYAQHWRRRGYRGEWRHRSPLSGACLCDWPFLGTRISENEERK